MTTRPSIPTRRQAAARLHTIEATDGVPLHVREYLPAGGNISEDASRTLLVSHGLGEHGGRYEHLTDLATQRGWRVLVGDHRGHGHSGGCRTHIRCFSQYTADLDAIWHRFELEPSRAVLLGHSMGGLIAIRHVQRYWDRFGALVLSSPLLRMKLRVPRTVMAVGKALSVVLPKTRFSSRIEAADDVRPPEVRDRFRDCNLVERTVTASWFFAMQRALRNAWTHAPRLRMPIFLAQASDDDIVDVAAARPWLDRTGSPSVSYRLIPRCVHETLHEWDWEPTWVGILDWLDERVPVS